MMTARLKANSVNLATPTVETTAIQKINVETQESGSLPPTGPLLTLVETSHNGPRIYSPLNLSREKAR
eukprot:558143-Pyramimonas_sp.AAC.1